MTDKPNVVVLMSDQQRWDCSGLHGNPLNLMPTFDRLAHAGTHVTNSFTCQPVCGPARSTLQLGRYPTNTGVWKNGPTPDITLPSLAGSFRAAGYSTGYVGKWHLYDFGDGDPGPVPVEARLDYENWLASNILEFTSDAYQTRLFDENNRPVDLYGYRVDACVDAGMRQITQLAQKDAPFFTFISLLEPHHQNSRDDYPAPRGGRESYEGSWMPPDLAALSGPGTGSNAHGQIAGYYGMVRRIDDALGRLHDLLVSLGIEEDTILLFTSDHGCHFKTRNSEYKRSLHEASIRVPTMLSGGPFTGGGALPELVSHVDLPPTLLDACGIPIPETFEGRSIVPLLRSWTRRGPAIESSGGTSAGKTENSSQFQDRIPPWPEEVYIQISEAEIGRAIRTKRWKYGIRAPGSFESAAAFTSPTAETMQETFLYDLYSDPYELNNLIEYKSHRNLAETLRERLVERIKATGEPVPEILPPDQVRPAGQLTVSESEY
jgi:arylsulfatase A-like enzyme